VAFKDGHRTPLRYAGVNVVTVHVERHLLGDVNVVAVVGLDYRMPIS